MIQTQKANPLSMQLSCYKKSEGITFEYISINGLNTRYAISGSGPSVLLIHGLGEFLGSWLFSIPALEKHFTTYAIDLPGSGLSEKPHNNYTIGFAIQFLIDFMDKMGISQTSLVGHSLGGLICLGLAQDYTDMVDKLILVNSLGFTNKVSLSHCLAAVPGISNILLGTSFLLANRFTARLGMRRQFYRPNDIPQEWVDSVLNNMKMEGRKETIQRSIRDNVNIARRELMTPIFSKLPDIQTKTLLIHGMQDKIVPVQHAYGTSQLIPNAQLAVLDRCGHNPQIEKPEEFNRIVIEFLTSN
jgi:pimeloyl-ACP methyl ester carboxylesterase